MPGLFTIQDEFHYEIVRKIFEGGMGVVYEAEQRGARDFVKRIAIKVIRQSYANQKMFIENFIGEAKLVADLIYTNIVQTYHLGEARGIYFIAMELIRGVNLGQFHQQLKDKQRVLPVELAVFITSRVARGLAYAHAKMDKDGKTLGIVHRDVSFKNVMIAFEGDVKLTDFGIAKARGFCRTTKAKWWPARRITWPGTGGFSDHRQTIRPLLRRHCAGPPAARLQYFQRRFRRRIRQRVLTLPIPDFRPLTRALTSAQPDFAPSLARSEPALPQCR